MSALDRWQEVHGATDDARWEFERVIETVGSAEVVLEIGAHAGASLAIWIEEFKAALAIGVELEDSPRTRNALSELPSPPARIIYGDSTSRDTFHAVRTYLGYEAKVDFLYIDGDHTEHAVRLDAALYTPLVKDGGYICFDDAKHEDGVSRVMTEFPGGTFLLGNGDTTGKYLVRNEVPRPLEHA